MENTRKFFKVPLILLLLFFGFVVENASADPYDLDLLDSTCLANDITTGPLGWYCETPSGSFIITFFGINKAGVNGKIIDISDLDCNSFSINVEPSTDEPINNNNKPPIVTNGANNMSETSSTDETNNSDEVNSTNERSSIIKEGVTTFTNLQVKDPKHFAAMKSSDKQPSVEIQCTYFPPPFEAPKVNEKNE